MLNGSLKRVKWSLAEDYFTESKAAELLGMSVAKFHQQRMLGGFETVTNSGD